MDRAIATTALAADAAAVTEIVVALESSLYGHSAFSQADLEDEWSELESGHDARVIRDGDRIVGYGVVRERGELWRVDGYVHPDVLGRGIGRLVATGLEEYAARCGARRIQNAIFEADSAARRLLESLGYRAVRLFREMRIELEGPPPAPEWPDGLRVVPFDPEHDAREFHAAHQEAFADSWDITPLDFERWSKLTLESERFDPTLWCVVRAEEGIAAGTICTADTYGGGFVQALFVRRPWRRRGVGAALLGDAFGRFWERGERSVGLGVDAASATGAFRLYERAGMAPALGWVVYEKGLGDATYSPPSMGLSDCRVEAALAVSDLEHARHFYEHQLGLVPGEQEEAGVHYSCAQGTGVFVYLTPENAGKSAATLAGWYVDDLEKTMDELASRGVVFERYDQPGLKTDERGVFEGPRLRAAWARDPDGNTIALTQVTD